MTVWAAVDGGQSGLRLRWAGGEGRGPGYRHDEDGVRATVDSVRRAAREAGLPAGHADVACLGLSGHPHGEKGVSALAKGVAEVLGAREVRICSDMVTAHAGALPRGEGVVLSAGTGVVCLAVRGDGSWHKVDGAGFLFGDAGSAFAIGRAALAAVVRARDGRGPATSLAALSETPERFYTSPDVVRDVAALAPAVLACAAGGDPVARNVLESAAADLAETASAAIAWFGGEHVQLACVGGLFAGGEQVVAPLRRFLPPQADLVPADGTSLDGAERLTASVPSSYQALVSTHRLASSSRGSCARI